MAHRVGRLRIVAGALWWLLILAAPFVAAPLLAGRSAAPPRWALWLVIAAGAAGVWIGARRFLAASRRAGPRPQCRK